MIHPMPPDTQEKEKIIGGILTLPQGAWIGLPTVGFAGISLSLMGVLGKLIFVLVPVGFGLGCLFAFKKKLGYSLFKYMGLKRKFNKKEKSLINTRDINKDFDI